jgi:uncharacterized membrane protein YhhN
MRETMTQPDRYADTEPLIPDWAAPVYLWVAGITSATYFLMAFLLGGAAGMALVKALSVVLLAAYAAFSRAPILTLALLLSAGGDYALAMVPPEREMGIGFFASAHIAYIAIFALMIVKTGFKRDGVALAIGLGLFGAAIYWWLSSGLGEMAVPVTAYLIIILAMAVLAGFVKGPRLIALGAVLFVVSDSLIAAGWFRGMSITYGRIDLVGAVIWITYYAAQLCLAVGVVRYKRLNAGSRP